MTTVAKEKPRWLGWVLLAVGIIVMAGSCFDRGVTDLDDTRLTQPVCGDLPQNDPRVLNGECRTSREVLDENGGIDHPIIFTIGGLAALFGIAIITGIIWKRPATYKNV